MSRLWIVLLVVWGAEAWAKAPAIGDTCVLKKAMKLRAKPGGKVLETAKPGVKLEVLEVMGGWVVLEGGRAAGYASLKDYGRACKAGGRKAKEPKEKPPAAPAKPEPTPPPASEAPTAEPAPPPAEPTPADEPETAPPAAPSRPLVEEVAPPPRANGPRENDPTDLSSPLTLFMTPDASPRDRRASAATWRTVGYIGVGVGGVGLVGGATLYVVARGKAAALRDDIAAFAAQPVRTQAEADALAGRRATVGRLDSLTVIGLGVGAAALGTGIALWVANSDGGRRGRAALSPTGGGLVLVPLGSGVAIAGEF